MHGYICSAPLYEYTHEGRTWLIECPKYGGPWPVRKDTLELIERAGNEFWEAWDALQAEPDPEKFRVGGGCERFYGGD